MPGKTTVEQDGKRPSAKGATVFSMKGEGGEGGGGAATRTAYGA